MEKKKILVIDDDPEIRDVLEALFKIKGYDVLKAKNGKEGFEVLEKENPALIVIDIMMTTVVEGIKIAKEIKENEKWSHIPIIGLSGFNNQYPIKIVPDKEIYPVDVFITKPFIPNEFLKEVKRLIK